MVVRAAVRVATAPAAVLFRGPDAPRPVLLWPSLRCVEPIRPAVRRTPLESRPGYSAATPSPSLHPWDGSAIRGTSSSLAATLCCGNCFGRDTFPSPHLWDGSAIRGTISSLAVRHARAVKEKGKKGLTEGPACYDGWIKGFQKPDYKRGVGDAYCYGIYRDTHRAASAFLREIAPRYPEARAQLEQAAAHFLAEADAMKGAESLLWWKSPAGPDAARNERAVKVLQKARDEYAAGVEAIEQALTQIEKEP